MHRMLRFGHPFRRQAGFTLIELLIVIAIIGIIAALLIPNMLATLQKAKQKKTIAEERLVGTALMAWLTDQAGSAAAGSSAIDLNASYTAIGVDNVRDLLVPIYVQTVPELDGWNNPYDYRINVGATGAARVIAIRSFARYGLEENGGVYSAGPFPVTDYDQDIIWADGYFVRWPEGLNTTP